MSSRRAAGARGGIGKFTVTSTDKKRPIWEAEAKTHYEAARQYATGYQVEDGVKIKVMSKDIVSTDWDLGIGTHYIIRSGQPYEIGRHPGGAGQEDDELPLFTPKSEK